MRIVKPAMLALIAALAGSARPPEASIEAIREQAAIQLRNTADFLCTELVDRARWGAGDSDKEPPAFEDALRLEVGFVGGNEVFGWPGAESFDEQGPAEMLIDGAFSTGDFLSHARALFGSRKGEARFDGEDEIDGVPALRFDYEVADFPTGYRVRTASGAAEVLYHGRFWADAESLAVRRLTVVTGAIPATIGIASVETTIDYSTTRLAAGRALLPTRVAILTRYADGALLRNSARFENCRAFETSASIRFDVELPDAGVASEDAEKVAFAPGEGLFLRLRTPIEWGVSRVGDVLEAELLRPAKTAEGVLEKGAVVELRVRRLQRRSQPEPFFVVGLSLEGRLAELESLTAAGADITLIRTAPSGTSSSHSGIDAEGDAREGVGSFYVFGKSLRLRDARMRWRTAKP